MECYMERRLGIETSKHSALNYSPPFRLARERRKNNALLNPTLCFLQQLCQTGRQCFTELQGGTHTQTHMCTHSHKQTNKKEITQRHARNSFAQASHGFWADVFRKNDGRVKVIHIHDGFYPCFIHLSMYLSNHPSYFSTFYSASQVAKVEMRRPSFHISTGCTNEQWSIGFATKAARYASSHCETPMIHRRCLKQTTPK